MIPLEFYCLLLILLWAGVIGYYLYEKYMGDGKSSLSKKKKKNNGKRCPQCKNLIDANRKVCQHCGHEFPEGDKHKSRSYRHLSGSRHLGGKKKKRGKHCPGCGQIVDYRREVCQHCGYEFFEYKKAADPGETAGQASP